MRLGWLLLAAAVGLASCSTRPVRPSGPPPEYERPKVLAWDAGAAQDLPDLDTALDDAAEGEWVDDYPEDDAGTPPPLEPGAGAPTDAGADGGGAAEGGSPEGGKPGDGSDRGV